MSQELAEQERAFWLWVEAVDAAGDLQKIVALLDAEARAGGFDRVVGKAFVLFSVVAWPTALKVLTAHGVPLQALNDEIGGAVRDLVTDFLRSDVTPEEATHGR